MSKSKKKNKNKNKNSKKQSNIFSKIYHFFIPKNFSEELYKGRMLGEQIRQGQISIIKYVPTYWIGKGLRKLIDPRHKMKIGSNKNGQKE